MLRLANTCFQEEKRNKLQNLFELELRTAVREQLYTNRTADIHSTVSYQPTKPTTQRDHLGLQILRKNETQTRPKRDPNETQDPTPHTKTQWHNDCQDVTLQVGILLDMWTHVKKMYKSSCSSALRKIMQTPRF